MIAWILRFAMGLSLVACCYLVCQGCLILLGPEGLSQTIAAFALVAAAILPYFVSLTLFLVLRRVGERRPPVRIPPCESCGEVNWRWLGSHYRRDESSSGSSAGWVGEHQWQCRRCAPIVEDQLASEVGAMARAESIDEIPEPPFLFTTEELLTPHRLRCRLGLAVRVRHRCPTCRGRDASLVALRHSRLKSMEELEYVGVVIDGTLNCPACGTVPRAPVMSSISGRMARYVDRWLEVAIAVTYCPGLVVILTSMLATAIWIVYWIVVGLGNPVR